MKSAKNKKQIIWYGGICAVFVIMTVFAQIISKGTFLRPANVRAILASSVIMSFMTWAVCCVFSSGFIDLSMGPVYVLVANVAGEIGNHFGIIPMVICSIVVGVLLCVINNMLYVYTGISGWILGLMLVLIYESFGAFYGKAAVAANGQIALLADDKRILALMPWILIIFFIGLALMYLYYNRSSAGISMRAVGSRRQVAQAMGIPVKKTIIIAAVIAGIFVGSAGFLTESNEAHVVVRSGLKSIAYILKPLSVYLLASVLGRHINIIIAVPFCALLEYMLFNILSILKVPAGTLQEVCAGALIIVFGIIAQRGTKEVVK